MAAPVTRAQIFEALRPVKDPELGFSVVDLGLIYDAVVAADGVCTLRYTLTSPTCPFGEEFAKSVQDTIRTLPGVTAVRLDLTFDPPWGPEKIAEPLRRELRMMGMAV